MITRREVLIRAGRVGSALTVGVPAVDTTREPAAPQPGTRKLKVVVAVEYLSHLLDVTEH